VPATLNWDLWLGPAKYRPYHPAYLPSVGVAGGTWHGRARDIGCHQMDAVSVH